MALKISRASWLALANAGLDGLRSSGPGSRMVGRPDRGHVAAREPAEWMARSTPEYAETRVDWPAPTDLVVGGGGDAG